MTGSSSATPQEMSACAQVWEEFYESTCTHIAGEILANPGLITGKLRWLYDMRDVALFNAAKSWERAYQIAMGQDSESLVPLREAPSVEDYT